MDTGPVVLNNWNKKQRNTNGRLEQTQEACVIESYSGYISVDYPIRNKEAHKME